MLFLPDVSLRKQKGKVVCHVAQHAFHLLRPNEFASPAIFQISIVE